MKIKPVKIFNTTIPLKAYTCNEFGDCNISRPDYLDFLGGTVDYGAGLYIYVQGSCNASCKFCNIHCENNDKNLNFDTLESTLKELKNKVNITRIGLTGGEPFLDFERLDKTITTCKKYFPDISLSVHTNGSFLNKINQLKELNHLDELHISRHHYDDDTNNEIFRLHASQEHDICNISQKLNNKVCLNCLLIKNYVDTMEKIEKYLEWAIRCGVHKVAFVDLTNLNDYCKNKFVNLFKLNPGNSFYTHKAVKNIDICSCFHGTYTSPYSNETVSLFFRQTKAYPTKCYHYLEFKNNKLFAGENEIPNTK